MKRAVLLLCLLAAACSEPDFDERYSEKEKQLASEAAAMSKELDKRMTEKPGLESEAPETPAAAVTQ